MSAAESEQGPVSLYETGPAPRTESDLVSGFPAADFSVERLERESAAAAAGKHAGWYEVDRLDARFQPAELTIVGARGGHGKTAFMTGLLRNWLRQEEPAGRGEMLVYYSVEEPEVRLYHRLLAATTAEFGAGWTLNEVRDRLRGADSRGASYVWPDVEVLDAARESARSWEERLAIVYQPSWSIHQIEVHAQALASKKPVGAVIVDYLQRIPTTHDGAAGRGDPDTAHRLKALSVRLNAPVVAGARLRRRAWAEGARLPEGVPYDHDGVQKAIRARRPRLQDFATAGCEDEADLLLGLLNYRADFESDLCEERRPAARIPNVTKLEVGLLKSRYGTPGRWAELAFEARYGLLRDPHGNEV